MAWRMYCIVRKHHPELFVINECFWPDRSGAHCNSSFRGGPGFSLPTATLNFADADRRRRPYLRTAESPISAMQFHQQGLLVAHTQGWFSTLTDYDLPQPLCCLLFPNVGRLLPVTTNSNAQLSADHGHEACWSKCNQVVKWRAIPNTAKLRRCGAGKNLPS